MGSQRRADETIAAGAPVTPVVPTPVVSVLLPLRLETRFFPPSGANGWKLRVRVVPDAASIDRHDPDPTAGELDDLELFLGACQGDLASERGKAEWSRFAARHGAARAAWLVRTFPPVPGSAPIKIARPSTLSTGRTPARISGLPPTLEIWLARGGLPAVPVATLKVDSSQLTLDMPDPKAATEPWWTSFQSAVAAGLGAEIDLGASAHDIDVLYVVGTGGDDPATLFCAHRDSGRLGVLTIGTPTNTVDGEPAADLAKDPDTWRTLLLTGGGSGIDAQAMRAVSTALTGQDETLRPLPGGGAHHLAVNQAMLAALWPAVFGHGLNDVLGVEGTPAAGAWALDNVVPEGPFPSIRIEDQPYGLLPVTALASWKPEANDPPVEEAMRSSLLDLRDIWVAAAEKRGTVVGADTDRLLEVIGQTPRSMAYSYRWFVPLSFVHAMGYAAGSAVSWTDLLKWWTEAATLPVSALKVPAVPYSVFGYVHDVTIPLLEPDNLPLGFTLASAIRLLVMQPAGALAKAGKIPDRGPLADLLRVLPNSLFLRLLVLSLNRGDAGAALETNGEKSTLFQPPFVPDGTPTLIAQWAQTPIGQFPPGLATQIASAVRAGASELAGSDLVPLHVPTLERVMKAVLDMAAYRLDPWLTGYAWRRFRSLASARFELGVYGWVDAPRPKDANASAPVEEFLHAPSEPQALTAAILRDRALSDPEPARWHMDLHSNRVRLADELAAEVRLGTHISEALGRAVERAVGRRSDVERLRTLFPIRTEHAGRRVCDGQAVLAQLADDPKALGLNAAQRAALVPVADAADAYADLLVADAVHDVVNGRGAMAASSMEAASGLGAPPDLDVIRTQRHGRAVSTSVLIALPVPPVVKPTGPVGPGRIAEPAVAVFLDTAFGSATGPAWTWQVLDDRGMPIGKVTLGALGLSPIDTISLSSDDLRAAVLDLMAGATVVPEGGLDAHARTRRMAHLFGSQPARLQDLADHAMTEDDSAIRTDLLGRYSALRSAAQTSLQSLDTAFAGTEAQQRAALRDARRWGITPLTLDGAFLKAQVGRARDALSSRLQTAPGLVEAAELGIVELARAIAELASPEGRIPVLARHRLDTLPAKLTPEPIDPSPARTDLDPDWLEVVAAVREPVARLEAFQLEQRGIVADDGSGESVESVIGSPPPPPPDILFRAWTNHPGDPWQTAVPNGLPAGLAPTSKLVAVFGPPGVLDPGSTPTRSVALGLLDSWTETIPATDHATSVAFHVDAPTSRAPQAILIGVPPVMSAPPGSSTLIQIVADARALARVRAVTASDLDGLSAALPLTWVPITGTTGILHIEPVP